MKFIFTLVFLSLFCIFSISAQNETEIDLSFLDSIKIPPVKIEREKEEEDFVCILIIEPVATFEGGMENFYKVIRDNLEFPKEAKEGRVFFKFVVDTTGKMTDIEFMKSPSEENNKVVLKLIDFINANYSWQSAQQRGKKVKIRMCLPIVFKREVKVKSNTERVYER